MVQKLSLQYVLVVLAGLKWNTPVLVLAGVKWNVVVVVSERKSPLPSFLPKSEWC